MTVKVKESQLRVRSKTKVRTKTKGRVVPLSENRIASAVTTIGYQAAGLTSGKSLKLSDHELKERLGGKAAGLCEMMKLGVPVPPAFNLSTSLCQIFLMRQELPAPVWKKVEEALKGLEKNLKRGFGDPSAPLLLSVRSGAPVSMPGMMDTILNLGLNSKITAVLATRSPENARFWWDCYRRFIFMFSDVVLGLSSVEFEDILESEKRKSGVRQDSQLSVESLERICEQALEFVKSEGKDFPQEPLVQLEKAVEAVFRSWNSDRAVHYRRLHKIPEHWGTAVTVQAMVFGNLNDQSGTGVVFTRNPSTGAKEIYGEFLMNAQGEDVVAGIRTPEPIEELKALLPRTYQELVRLLTKLENHFSEVQDVEFTIENQKLYILQTRAAKRTATAAIEHFLQLVKEKKITKEEALRRIQYDQVRQLLHPSLKSTKEKPLGKGLPASPGAVSGLVAFDPESAQQMARAQSRVILVRRETSPEDIMGMAVSEGILTSTGGMTSHAAVVGRGMGKSCVVGCSDLRVDEKERKATIGGREIREGDRITINGSTGEVYWGELPTEPMNWTRSAQSFFKWADEKSSLRVLANADTAEQASVARSLGAQGIGLCRTEHMFFEPSRLRSFRKLILSESEDERAAALSELLPHQRDDFKGILAEMMSLSVCVRLLDPPLHEFLPRQEDVQEIQALAESLGTSESKIRARIEILHEQNPMLGHRGCRLGITHPEIYQMQVEALALALAENFREGIQTELKIMIPLIVDEKELAELLNPLKEHFYRVLSQEKADRIRKNVKWGTMIEIPRACLRAEEIAPQVDFISFGTNDLTQTTMGLSRDDSSKFLPAYLEKKLFAVDPFESLDQSGVGELVSLAVQRGRRGKKNLEVGICGEHGGDPASIEFFSRLQFDSVSCSPFRVPIARLALGKAQMGKKSMRNARRK